MKKSLIITIAILILLLALGSWIYLFLFGTPQTSDEFFADLGFEIGQQAVTPIESDVVTEPTLSLLDTTNKILRQLTLRPVAGFIALPNDIVRYVERGTGHIYDIDTTVGTEVRRTNTTIPQVVKAVFSSDGTQVALTSETSYTRTSVYGSFDENAVDTKLSTNNLPPQADNVSFIGTSTLGYTRGGELGTTGYRLDTTNQTQVVDFEIPFRSVIAVFAPNDTYIYNRHAPELTGGLFVVDGRALNQIGSTEFGLTALIGPSWYNVTFTENNSLLSRIIDPITSTLYESPIVIIPEKCTWDTDNTIWCGLPVDAIPFTYQKDWYQGEIRSNDALWKIDPVTESATLMVNPQTEVGRQIDITELQIGTRQVFFTNRLDDTLWLYDETTS